MEALSLMKAGKHGLAAGPLKDALLLDRNEPLGLIALGTLYLHTGSPARAAAEFGRASSLAPAEPLARFGLALAALMQGRRDPAAFEALPAARVPVAQTLAAYVRLMSGDAAGARPQNVTPDEPDLLRLELAGFAALRGGDGAGGEALLRALLSRPGMGRLAEDRALILPFEPGAPAEAGAPALLSSIGFPAPGGGPVLSGRVTLTPGDLPPGVVYVGYYVQGVMSATTNYAPFTQEWNTTRVPGGLYTMRVTVYGSGNQILRDTTRTVRVANAGAAAPVRVVRRDPEAADWRARLLALLTPRPSRKAAHHALAERAAARGEGEAALRHIEAVVAIDPNFHNARLSLRRYNLRVLGPREGIWRANTGRKLIALTFDDGPNPARTPALLEALKKEAAPATFFVVGVWAERVPELLRRMRNEGHDVENHSYSHQNLALLTPASVERELCRTSVLIREATGRRPRFYRPPGGNVNRTVVDAAEAMGMIGAYWTTATTKIEETGSARALTQYVLKNAMPGAIILMHNAPDVTVQAVPGIVRALRARGYELVTMSDLVRRSNGGIGPVAAKRGNRKRYGG